MSVSKEDREELHKYVDCVLKRWWGLQAAIQDNMGSNPARTKQNVDHMIETITELCFTPQIMKEDIWDTLEDLSESYFNLQFEDGSPEEVAQLLWSDSRDFLMGNRDKIQSFVDHQQKLPAPCVKVDSHSDDDSNDEVEDDQTMEMDSVETTERGPDEEGWELPRHTFKPKRKQL